MKLYYRVIAVALVFALNGCATSGTRFNLDPGLEQDIRSFGGVRYLPLDRTCRMYGMECDWDAFIQKAHVHTKSTDISLRSGSDLALVNGETERLDKPAMMRDGRIYVPLSFVKKRLTSLAAKASFERPPVETPSSRTSVAIKTVVLDPGHGGKDNGATGRRLRLKEKNLALDLAGKIRMRLEENGLRVVMTRSNDTFVPLQRRADAANDARADLFVSVHINASRSRYLRGFECYYLSDAADDNARALEALRDSSPRFGAAATGERSSSLDRTLWDMALTEDRIESASIARYICRSVDESLAMGNNGVKSARFYVLKNARMPAVLVEAGYLSNRYEELKMKDPAFLDKLAAAVVDGIMKFKREYEETRGYSS